MMHEEQRSTPFVDGHWPTLDGQAPLIIAHRGASGERPEHTIAAYRLAIEQGADAVETDVVVSRDGALVCRHDAFLSSTTDVADRPEFAGRRRLGPQAPRRRARIDWWVEDFGSADLQALRARRRFADRPSAHDGLYPIVFLDELLDLTTARKARLILEVKKPSYFESIGLDPFERLVATLRNRGLDNPHSGIVIESFDSSFLQRLAPEVGNPIVQLIGRKAVLGPGLDLGSIAGYAVGVAISKKLLIGGEGAKTRLITRAHDLGLLVHAWTFGDDLPTVGGVTAKAELALAVAAGADGVVTDFPKTARALLGASACPS